MEKTAPVSASRSAGGSDRAGRRALRRRLLGHSALVGLIALAPVLATADTLPGGASVSAGSVAIQTPSPNAMTITQGSDRAVVNWQDFSIGQGASVDIRQPGRNSAILNRVTGTADSRIHGRLSANGQVYVVNPNGIHIGPNGQVQAAGGFVASTLGIADDDFTEGRLRFEGNGASATVRNEGTIAVSRHGFAALLGGRVRNEGTVTVPMGRVAFGAGERATLDLTGDGFLQIAVPSADDGDESALIDNSGTVSAEGGRIEMRAATAREAVRNAVNLSGVAEARSVSMRNGVLVLGGGDGGRVRVTGTASTRAVVSPAAVDTSLRPQARPPARIDITGAEIVLDGATIDASGAGGGGTIRIGGDFRGAGTLPRAARLTAGGGTVIAADALGQGEGGRIVLWSERITDAAAVLSARGGAQGGDGGLIEVSSRQDLRFSGVPRLDAPAGAPGTFLIDPINIAILPGSNPDPGSPPPPGPGNPPTNTIFETDLETWLATADVVIDTADNDVTGQVGTLRLLADIDWANTIGDPATTLTLRSNGLMQVFGNLVSAGGSAVLDAGGDLSLYTEAGSLTSATPRIALGGTLEASSGRLDPTGNIVIGDQSGIPVSLGASSATLSAQRVVAVDAQTEWSSPAGGTLTLEAGTSVRLSEALRAAPGTAGSIRVEAADLVDIGAVRDTDPTLYFPGGIDTSSGSIFISGRNVAINPGSVLSSGTGDIEVSAGDPATPGSGSLFHAGTIESTGGGLVSLSAVADINQGFGGPPAPAPQGLIDAYAAAAAAAGGDVAPGIVRSLAGGVDIRTGRDYRLSETSTLGVGTFGTEVRADRNVEIDETISWAAASNLFLLGSNALFLDGDVSGPAGSAEIRAGNNLFVNRSAEGPLTLDVGGPLELFAGLNARIGDPLTASSAQAVTLSAPAAAVTAGLDIDIDADIVWTSPATGTLAFESGLETRVRADMSATLASGLVVDAGTDISVGDRALGTGTAFFRPGSISGGNGPVDMFAGLGITVHPGGSVTTLGGEILLDVGTDVTLAGPVQSDGGSVDIFAGNRISVGVVEADFPTNPVFLPEYQQAAIDAGVPAAPGAVFSATGAVTVEAGGDLTVSPGSTVGVSAAGTLLEAGARLTLGETVTWESVGTLSLRSGTDLLVNGNLDGPSGDAVLDAGEDLVVYGRDGVQSALAVGGPLALSAGRTVATGEVQFGDEVDPASPDSIALSAASATVTSAGGDVDFDADVTWSGGPMAVVAGEDVEIRAALSASGTAGLALSAAGDVVVGESLDSDEAIYRPGSVATQAGPLALEATEGAGVGPGSSVSSQSGTITLTGDTVIVLDDIVNATGPVIIDAGSVVAVGLDAARIDTLPGLDASARQILIDAAAANGGTVPGGVRTGGETTIRSGEVVLLEGDLGVGSNTSVTASDTIAVNREIAWETSGALGLFAPTVSLAAPILAPGGTLRLGGTLVSGSVGSGTYSGGLFLPTGAAEIDIGTLLVLSGDWVQNAEGGTLAPFTFRDPASDIAEGSIFLRVQDGDGSAGDPFVIVDLLGLRGIATLGDEDNPVEESFVLGNDIDASQTATLRFSAVEAFRGTFDGRNNTISNLVLTPDTEDEEDTIGLFLVVGQGGVVRNLLLENVSGTGDYGGAVAGAVLAGGTLDSVFASGRIETPGDSLSVILGGLTGVNAGVIRTSRAEVDIDATIAPGAALPEPDPNFSGAVPSAVVVGGVAGANFGLIDRSVAFDPTIEITNNSTALTVIDIGGLVGRHGQGGYLSGLATGLAALDPSAAPTNAIRDSYWIEPGTPGVLRVNDAARTARQTFGALVGYAGAPVERSSAFGSIEAFGGGYYTASSQADDRFGDLIGAASAPGLAATSIHMEFAGEDFFGNPAGAPELTYDAVIADPRVFETLARSLGWNFETVWAPRGNGSFPAQYATSPVIFAVPDDTALDLGEGETTVTTTGTTFGGPGLYVFDQPAAELGTGAAFENLPVDTTAEQPRILASTRSLTASDGTVFQVAVDGARVGPAPGPVDAEDPIDPPRILPEIELPDPTDTTLGVEDGEAGVGGLTLVDAGAPPVATIVAGAAPPAGAVPPGAAAAPPGGVAAGAVSPPPAGAGAAPPEADPLTPEEALERARQVLAVVEGLAGDLQSAVANCSPGPEGVDGFLGCLSNGLEEFASELDEIASDLPPQMENVAQIVRDAQAEIETIRDTTRQQLDAATTDEERQQIAAGAVTQAVQVLEQAAAEVRESFDLITAEDPDLQETQQATVETVAAALETAGTELLTVTEI